MTRNSSYPGPNPDYFEEYVQWLQIQGKAETTIKGYLNALQRLPHEVEDFFATKNVRSKKLNVVAYRSYLHFLTLKKNKLSRGELMNALETFKPPKKRGNNSSDRKWSVPKSQWANYIRIAPTPVAKMGMWIGFQFGLRLSEITHLRIQDIDFESQEIRIRGHNKTKRQEAWNPKYHRERQIPFTQEQGIILKRWIRENRPFDLSHNYLLWTLRGSRKEQMVLSRSFQRWCKITGLNPHILRYSFATHYYNESKDVKLISELLGHANVSTTSEYLQFGKKEVMKKARDLFKNS